MGKREFALTVGLPFAIGILPYLLDKRGIAVPSWVVIIGGVVAMAAVGHALFYPARAIFEKSQFARPDVPRPTVAALLVIVAMVAALGTGWTVAGSTGAAHYEYRKWSDDRHETISQRTYMNESVEIDGKLFDHCTFTNVTLVYHGTAESTFLEPRFSGTMGLRTDNIAVRGFEKLANYLRNCPRCFSTFRMGWIDPKGHIEWEENENLRQPRVP